MPKGSEFNVTTCSAYIPTTRPAPLDTEYEPVQVPSQGPQQGQGSTYEDITSAGPVKGQSSAAHGGAEYAEVGMDSQGPNKGQSSAVMGPDYEEVAITGTN